VKLSRYELLKECLGTGLIFSKQWIRGMMMDIQEVGCASMDWIELAQDRNSWRTLVNAVMKLRVL
jgi:hypothetical protein